MMRFRRPFFVIGCTLLLLEVCLAIFSPLFAPNDFLSTDLSAQLLPPSSEAWFGKDQNGSDVFWKVILGTRLSLFVGLVSVSLSLIIGCIVGAVSGYFGGFLDTLIMRFVDIFLAFPGFLLALGVAAVLGTGVWNLIFALLIVGWVPYARLTRALFLSLREQDFVLAARSTGVETSSLIFKHILPLCIAPLLVQATFSLAGAILTEASLSFLGLGAPPEIPSWGRLLSHGTRYLLEAAHLSIFPGIFIMVSVLALNFIGDGLRDILDVREVK